MKHWWDTRDLRREEERRLNAYLESLDAEEDQYDDDYDDDLYLEMRIENETW